MLRQAAPKALTLTPDLHAYLLAHGAAPDPLAAELVERTRVLVPEQAHMTIAPEEGALLTFLVRLTGARTIVEIGTFTGYSGLCLARGLPRDGRLITCDVSAQWTDLAREFWERAGVADRIELRLGPALETLRGLPRGPWVDLAFIDADKPGYIDYWEELVPRMRPGGLVLVDNTLFGGEVVAPVPGPKPAAVHAFNTHACADPRVELVMLPVADGLTLARRLGDGDERA